MKMTPRKPPAGFWIAIALVVVLTGYPLSFGPACWWFSRDDSRLAYLTYFGSAPVPKRRFAPHAYWPIGWLAAKGPRSIRHAIFWYAMLGADGIRYDTIALPIDNEGVQHYDSRFLAL